MISYAWRALPSISAEIAALDISNTELIKSKALSSSPINISAETATLSNFMFAAFLESTILVGIIANPSEFASKMKRERPSLFPSSPEVLQAITILSANPPSMTKDFSPEILKLSPSFSALQDIFKGSWWLFSSIAKQSLRPSWTTFERISFFIPSFACLIKLTPTTAVENKGEGVSVLPSSSRIEDIPATPKLEPPYSSGTKIPVQPRDTISCQIFSS